jgi:hypothetical protein
LFDVRFRQLGKQLEGKVRVGGDELFIGHMVLYVYDVLFFHPAGRKTVHKE